LKDGSVKNRQKTRFK